MMPWPPWSLGYVKEHPNNLRLINWDIDPSDVFHDGRGLGFALRKPPEIG